MLTKEQFKNEFEKILQSKSILNHPFYQKWNEGKLTVSDMQEYAKQYHHFVKHFPMFVSSVHSYCDDTEIRKMLVENIADEDGFKTGISDHPELWANFAKAFGVSKSEAENTEVKKEVMDSINGFYELCRNSDYRIGLGALYGYEKQIPEVSKIKIEGLKKYYNITEKEALEFFTVHQEADIYHSEAEFEALYRSCKTEQQQNNALKAAEKSAELYWQILDGVYKN